MDKRKIKKNLTAFVFIVFISAIMVMYFVIPKEDYSPLEKRYYESFPSFSGEALLNGDYTQGIENYLADHTPLRAFFVGTNSYYNLAIGNNGSNGVYLGKDNMLIEKPFSEDNLLERNVAKIKTFSEEIDIPVSMLVVPSKGYIYNEYLPANALEYKDEEYFDFIEKNLGDKINFVNILNEFNSASSDNKLFFKTDHHWTSLGAYSAYSSLCDAMGLDKKSEDDFIIESYDNFYGTSYSTSAYYLTKREEIEVWRDKESLGVADIEIIEGQKSEKYDNMFFDDNLKGDDKYTVFLDGNHSMVKIHNDSADSNKKLLIIKDSFAHCLTPFLSAHYSDIVMVDLRYYKLSLTELIKTEKCDETMFVYGIENLCTSTDIILY
ncbi:MAG: DHHW family protein [Clostridia bacterium]|nr:DHHW family protein [Clostridia bacterium]